MPALGLRRITRLPSITRLPRAPSTGVGAQWFNAPAYADMAAVFDLNNDRYAITTVPLASVPTASGSDLCVKQAASRADAFAFSAASTTARSYLDSTGTLRNDLLAHAMRFDWTNGRRQFLLEGASTNVFLNSFTPATQTVAVTNGSQYTVSVRGAGSLLLSGAGTGTATQNSPVTFTASGSSLTATVSGTLATIQCEALPFSTFPIATASIAVTRAPETARFSPLVEAILKRSAWSAVVRAGGLYDAKSYGRIIGGSGGNTGTLLGSDTNNRSLGYIPGGSFTLGSGGLGSPAGLAFATDATGCAGIGNSGAVTTTGYVLAPGTQFYLSQDGGGVSAPGWYDFVGIAPSRLSNTRLQALAVAA